MACVAFCLPLRIRDVRTQATTDTSDMALPARPHRLPHPYYHHPHTAPATATLSLPLHFLAYHSQKPHFDTL